MTPEKVLPLLLRSYSRYYNIREETRDTYPFEQYREDIAVSSSLYLFENEKLFKGCDYVYIPPIGIKPTKESMIKATFAALQSINSPRMVAAKRGKKVGDIVSRRENTSSTKVEEA